MKHIKGLAQILPQMKSLQTLALSHSFGKDLLRNDQLMGSLFQSFSTVRTLRSLDISGNKFKNTTFDLLVNNAIKIPDLEEIALNNCNIGNQSSVSL